MNTLADVLHRLIDLVPWREELHQLDAHSIVARELETALEPEGAHAEAPAEAPAEDAPAKTTTK